MASSGSRSRRSAPTTGRSSGSRPPRSSRSCSSLPGSRSSPGVTRVERRRWPRWTRRPARRPRRAPRTRPGRTRRTTTTRTGKTRTRRRPTSAQELHQDPPPAEPAVAAEAANAAEPTDHAESVNRAEPTEHRGPTAPEPAQTAPARPQRRARAGSARLAPQALADARGEALEGLNWLGRDPDSRASILYRALRLLARFLLFVLF